MHLEQRGSGLRLCSEQGDEHKMQEKVKKKRENDQMTAYCSKMESDEKISANSEH